MTFFEKKNPRIFISHSHLDRSMATRIQEIIEAKGAETYLDQDKIQVGDELPDRLLDGISWSDIVLLIWSFNASNSKWVGNEWQMAHRYRKKIILYCLDNTKLPKLLEDLIFISPSDLDHANADLMIAVFGQGYKPDPSELFPGLWRLSVDAFGVGSMTYRLNLRKNGQITGQSQFDAGGLFGNMMKSEGFGNILNRAMNTNGSWIYESKSQLLTLDILTSGLGQTTQERIHIFTTGREKGEIYGKDYEGRDYVLVRE